MPNAYEELPYRSMPIEWTAPERLALASLLHGGPRSRLDEYRVLELGCADGANLLPMAFFRRNAGFVGIDSAESQIAIANTRKDALGVENIEFACTDFCDADRYLNGEFDFIIAHGVFSWIPDAVRDAILNLCAHHLRDDGLFYLNYNTYPGWSVRGMIRRCLLARTNAATSLRERALLAQEIAAELATSVGAGGHPFAQLLAKEFRFVTENHHSYVAHEYLAADNHAYWRSEFMQLVRKHGFEYVADADFSYPSGRVTTSPTPQPVQGHLACQEFDDATDLLCYRQLHSPILSLARGVHCPPSMEEFGNLTIASCLSVCACEVEEHQMFQHPSGYKVEAKEASIQAAFIRLRQHWPEGLRIGEIFQDVASVIDDLLLLQRNGLIEIRYPNSRGSSVSSDLLNRMEAAHGDYVTTPYHTREAVPIRWTSGSSAAIVSSPQA